MKNKEKHALGRIRGLEAGAREKNKQRIGAGREEYLQFEKKENHQPITGMGHEWEKDLWEECDILSDTENQSTSLLG